VAGIAGLTCHRCVIKCCIQKGGVIAGIGWRMAQLARSRSWNMIRSHSDGCLTVVARGAAIGDSGMAKYCPQKTECIFMTTITRQGCLNVIYRHAYY
jgi:hypothetical protein